MSLFITALIFIFVAITMILLVPIGLLSFILSFCGLRKPMSIMIYKVAQGWALVLIKVIGCRLTVRGQEHIPKTGGLCFVSNHASIFDILLILALVGRPVGFIAKKELALIPFLNIWIFLIGGLFIDRKNIRKAIRTINSGVQRIKRGSAMLIFPEGTRSRGHGLLPFKSGSFRLATQAGAPILPVAITGSYDVFEKNHRAVAADVSVTFAPPISANVQGDKRKEISDQAYEIISKLLEAQSAR
ncbi:MAG: 1-acyl-sn-glycerol-3-phosphate acyltransferase [Treponema sp.]|jgi:1-acyl-sn-glycerol-3-phosphate acyltransferase|nr:1-acyl-sn-glycerol-3-phosphate acyltransferase [Treponema sp.]